MVNNQYRRSGFRQNHLSIINNHLAFCPLHLSRILDKSHLFMQNKPNLPQNQVNASSVLTEGYEYEHRFLAQKSQSQFAKC